MNDSIPLSRTGPSNPRPNGSRVPSPHFDVIQHAGSIENAEAAARDIHPRWKRDLYLLLEHPTSSPSAFLIHVATTSLIIISAAVTVLETIPSSHSVSGSVWFGLETSLVALFTVEYIARAVAHSNTLSSFAKWFLCEYMYYFQCYRISYARRCPAFFGIIDLLGILPYYLEIALQQDTVRPSNHLSLPVPDLYRPLFSDSRYYERLGYCVYSDHSDITIQFCCAYLPSACNVISETRSSAER